MSLEINLAEVANDSIVDAENDSPTIAGTPAQVQQIRPRWIGAARRMGCEAPEAVYDRFVATLGVLGDADATPHVAIFQGPHGDCGAIIGRNVRRRMSCKFGYSKIQMPVLATLEIIDGGLLTNRSARAINQIGNYLLHDCPKELLIVEHLPTDHELFSMLASGAARAPIETHWLLDLPEKYADLLDGFSKKHRSAIRRRDRQLSEHFKGNLVFRKFATIDEVDAFIRGAAGIVSRTYQAGIGVGLADDQRWRAILETDAIHGRFRGYWLENAGQPIAFQAGAIWGETYQLLATSFAPELKEFSPGMVLHLRVIEALCDEKIRHVDYGFGDAEYKRTYGSRSRTEKTLRIYGSGARANFVRAAVASCNTVSRTANRIAELNGASSWIKRRWRQRLANSSQ